MDRETKGYYAAFSQAPGIGPLRFSRLLEYFGTARKAYEAPVHELEKAMDVHTVSQLVNFRSTFDIEKRLDECDSKGIHIIPRHDPRFPKKLLHFKGHPICFYAMGNLDVVDLNTDEFFAVVGTRNPSSYGMWLARTFTPELAQHFVIVSGMALGIDYIAHNAALEADGRTVAFLGCGVDIPYPRENHRLYRRIIEGGGLVMSEFPPGMSTLKGNFVSRNRHISGLARGIFAIEGGSRSGTLISAGYAAEQGTDLYVAPMPLNSSKSEAPLELLKKGATLVLSPADILSQYGLKASPATGRAFDFERFAEDEKKVLMSLMGESQRIDDIITSTCFSPSQAMNVLSMLEVKGVIEKNAEGRYVLA